MKLTKKTTTDSATIGDALSTSSSSVERDDHSCGQYKDNLTWAYCDPGRCCSKYYYCGDTVFHCNNPYCWYQCHQVPSPPPPPPDDETGGVITRLVNATRNNNYMNLNLGGGDHHDDQLVKVAADNASSSSSSSSPSSFFLSCARSLSRMSLASRYKYPFAALRVPRAQNNITAAHCGRCLKVTNLGRVGGLHSQVKVRIVDEPSNEGLELDPNTFKQLDTDGYGFTKGHLLVKYQFESC
ncbi:unnamed protein product [Linum tenue]|uniref:Barwin domain-containing protein n=1 Tax=Linum tenue TaxID=586396 RepID=A0AAV0JJZ7_9ROSI|nr:unnamed protein product [Linum tenue]